MALSRLFLASLSLAGAALVVACDGNGGNATPTSTATSGGNGGGGGTGGPQQSTGSVADVAEKAGPSVVRVGVNCVAGDASRCAGTGSGWLFDNDGDFVTNDHVVTLGQQVTKPSNILITTQSGRQFEATIVGQDPQTDLAVLKGNADGLEPLTLANVEEHRIGDPVVAIGYALDLGNSPSVTVGVISAVQRQILEPATSIYGLVQTDAAINPGNSGGPLLDLAGNVVGVNTATVQGAQGIGFAIGAETVQAVVKEIVEKGTVDRGYLGIGFQEVTPGLADELNLPVKEGIRIQQVEAGSPADRAGLRQGDIITKLGAHEIRYSSDLTIALIEQAPGDKVKAEYYRGDRRETADVTLGERPA